MHLPSTEKRHSVFYDYEIFPFRHAPEQDGVGERKQVVIIGAGPVGMVLALLLAKSGIRSVIIESEAQVSQGSRAVAFTRRSVEILQQAGVAEPFMKNGLAWNSGRSFYRGKEVFQMQLPHDVDDRFPPVLNNSQQYWEEYFVDAIERSDLIDLRWQTRFVALEDGPEGVSVLLDTPEGEYRLDAEWLVACDGGRSEVRRFLGLRMEGTGYEGKFVITDFKAPDLDLPTQRYCYFDPPWNPGNNVLVHRQPNDIWRFDYRLPDGEPPEVALDPKTIERRTRQIMEMIGKVVDWELDWATVYSPNTKTLPDYRHGHVLLAGDAAHLLPIFGIRGANTGLQDAENLAWKLAEVINGTADVSLLDSYSQERVLAAREICEEAGKSTRLMDPPSRGYRVMRDAVLSFTLTEDFCREMLHWRTSRPHEYTESAINVSDDDAAFDAGIPRGAVARNVKLGEDDYLFDHFRYCFTLLVFGMPGDGAARDARLLSGEKDIRVISVGGGVEHADVVIDAGAGRLFEKYGVGEAGMYLLRPDMHVCGRWKSVDFAAIAKALATIGKSGAAA